DLGVQCRLGQFLAAANGRSLPRTPAHSWRRLADETERVCLAAMRDLSRPGRARPRHRYRLYRRRQPGLEHRLSPSGRAGPQSGPALVLGTAHFRGQQTKNSLGQCSQTLRFSLAGERAIEIELVVCGRDLVEEKFASPFLSP